jgi:hypothetical protein
MRIERSPFSTLVPLTAVLMALFLSLPFALCREAAVGPSDQPPDQPADQPADSEGRTSVQEEAVPDSEPEVLRKKVHNIVARGHAYLAARQNKDGSFSVDPDDPSASAPIAVTALVSLSFMAGGNTPERGRYSRQLRDALSYLCKACSEGGEFVDDRDSSSRMHGQGFAILALAEAYGMYGISDRSVDRQKLADVLKRSVTLVAEIQTEIGGWYYDAKKTSDHEGSITICIIQGLRAARNSGIHVDRTVIDKAVRYVRKSQKKSDGSFRYSLNNDRTSYALTAAAVATLNATGDYDSEVIEKAMEYMLKKDPVLNFVSSTRDFYPQYARFYASQAYYQYRDRSRFERWYPKLVEQVPIEQRVDGAFPNPQFGPVYATAMATLTLQIPFGYLPVFQR